MAQVGVPSGDISAGSWVTAPLWSKVDEQPPNTADLISLPNNTTGACRLGTLKHTDGSALSDPGRHDGFVLHCYAQRTGSRVTRLVVSLYQGTTLIESSGTLTITTWADYSYNMTAANIANISDFTDLRIDVNCTASGSSNAPNVAATWLSYPDIFTQSVTGGLTPGGAIGKVGQKAVNGAVSIIAGTLALRIDRALAGVISTLVGVLSTEKTGGVIPLAVSGAISTLTGALARHTDKPLAGAVTTLSGSLGCRSDKNLAGQLSILSGELQLTCRLLVEGAIGGLAGQLQRMLQAQLSFTGALGSSGALTALKTLLLSLAGGLPSSGDLVRQAQKGFTGGASSAGEVAKQAGRWLAGAVSSSGALASHRSIGLALAGLLAPAGGLGKQVGKGIGGIVGLGGVIIDQIGKSLGGLLAPAGMVGKGIGKILSGLIDLAGALANLFVPTGAPPRAVILEVIREDSLRLVATIGDYLSLAVEREDALTLALAVEDRLALGVEAEDHLTLAVEWVS